MSASSQRVKRQKVQVVIFLTNPHDVELLLLKTTQKRGSYWQNVTGGVEPEDSSLEESASREVLEETGLKDIKVYSLNFETNFIDRWDTEVTEHLFLAIAQDDEKNISIDPSEHQDWGTLKIDEVSDKNFGFPSNYNAFTLAIKKFKEIEHGGLA